jgi:hypothetical protein
MRGHVDATDVRVLELCHRVSVERDAEKLLALIREANRLIAEKISRLNQKSN